MENKDVLINFGGRKNPISCSYCKRDVTLQLWFKCAECSDFFQCSDCFSAGVNLYPHRNTHNYHVGDCLDFPIFHKDWSASDELLLLEGIEKLGAGNWKAVSEYINNGKSPKMVEEHYWDHYMGIHGYCLPKMTLISGNQVETAQVLKEKSHSPFSPFQASEQYEVPVIDGYQKGESIHRDKLKEGGRGVRGESRSHVPPVSDLPGYMPLREDFDFEFENDAELILADMEFEEEEGAEHPSERELKLQVINIYNTKLRERERRKRFVIDRGIVDVKRIQAADRRLSREDRDLVSGLRVFARYQSAEEQALLTEGALKARRLRKRIELLQAYRKLGIRTLLEAREFEETKRRKEAEARTRRLKDTNPYLFETGRALSSSSESRRSVSRSSDTDPLPLPLPLPPLSVSSPLLIEDDGPPKPLEGEEELWALDASSSTVRAKGEAEREGGLSEEERGLCSELGINSRDFVLLRESIAKEAFTSGSLCTEGVRRAIRMEGVSADIVQDFVALLSPRNDPLADWRLIEPLVPSTTNIIPTPSSEPTSSISSQPPKPSPRTPGGGKRGRKPRNPDPSPLTK